MTTDVKTPSRLKNLFAEIARDFQPGRLVPSVSAGLIVGVVEVIVAISFAALIYSGSLSNFVDRGIGFAILSAIITGVTIALFSTLQGTVSGNQDVPAAVLAVIATAIAGSMPASATDQETFLTVAVAIALITTLTGAFFLVLGQLKLGSLVRFLPYPVMGGFMAGTGWLLVIGAITMMTDISPETAGLSTLFDMDILVRWLPGLIFAIAMLAILKRIDHFLTLPGLVIGAIALFYLFIWLTGISIGEISDQGWLLGPFPEGRLWEALSISDLAEANWTAIFGQAASIITVLIVSAVALLLNASGLELTAERDMGLNHELRTAGIGNLLAGLAGGMIGFHQLSISAMSHKLGAQSRLTGLFSAVVCVLVLFLGAGALSFFPKVILGGLLLYIGLSFLVEWVYETWFKLPKADYLVILLILVVIATLGFLEGVAIGILAAVILFVINYSQVEVVKHSLTAATYHSSYTRPRLQRRLLRDLGKQVFILELQGYIFFGTSNHLLEQMQELLSGYDVSRLCFIVLDFKRVTGIDSSVVLSFRKMKQLVRPHHARIVLTGLSSGSRSLLEKANVLDEDQVTFISIEDLDQGVEWCENQLLQSTGVFTKESHRTIEQQLATLCGDAKSAARIIEYLERMELPPGTCIIQQGDTADSLYFIEEGRVTAQLERADEKPRRLQTMSNENVVGEIGLYLRLKRTASVVTEEQSTIYRLSGEAMEKMEREEPEAAAVFHKVIAKLMADRISHMTDIVETMMG
jgi:SulP family sulfate permease